MELQRGKQLASEVVERLSPFCALRDDGTAYIEVVGSIRRGVDIVRDIDIILIQHDAWAISMALKEWGAPLVKGPKIERLIYKGAQVDFYFATKETWATHVLIRTGSKENNKRLCSHAKANGMTLRANGDGLFRLAVEGCEGHDVRIAGDTELSIYQALGLPYQRPEERK